MSRPTVSSTAAADSAARSVSEGARRAAPWLVPLARVGYAAKGVVYIVIALLALRAALGTGGDITDSRGALREIGSGPLGTMALAVIGLGLVGYALYAVLAAVTGAESTDDGGKDVAKRIGRAGKGLFYGALGVEALRLMSSARASSGDGTEHWTARLLALPFGRAMVIAAGLGVIAYALFQVYLAVAKDPRRHLDLGGTSATTASAVERLARFGIAARGVVFTLIGWFLVRAALRYDPEQAGGMDQSLATVAAQPFGRVLLAVVALGLASYGLYGLAQARWRRMRVA